MARRQASLMHKARPSADSPLRTYDRSLVGRVIDSHPKAGTVDIALLRGPILRDVPVTLDGIGSTGRGQQGLPQVWNSDKAFIRLTPDGRKQIYDEAKKTYLWDTFAIVQYNDGYHNQPYVSGWLNPNSHQLSFDEPNLELERHTADIHELYFTEEGIDIRPHPFGDAPMGHPPEVIWGNRQLIFPDRNKDYKVKPSERKFGNDHMTYISYGYHPWPRVFGDGKTSANFDNDKNPWKLGQEEKGDEEKHRKYARGITLNQRWRSRFQIDPLGNVYVRAEGQGFDSTEFKDTDTIEGRIEFWSRLETKSWNKHFGAWTRMRPRHDGGGQEDVPTAKKTGTYQMRVQRFLDIAVRKDAQITAKDTFTLQVGDFDTQWNKGILGDDPGAHWDDPQYLHPDDQSVLNPDFKKSVGDDVIWKGADFQDSANTTFHFRRWVQAKATGPQTFTFTMDPQKPATDAQWSRALTPKDGSTSIQSTQTPSAASKTALWEELLAHPRNPVTVEATANQTTDTVLIKLGHHSKPITVTLTAADSGSTLVASVQGTNPCTLTMNGETGIIAFTGVHITLNGTNVELITDPN